MSRHKHQQESFPPASRASKSHKDRRKTIAVAVLITVLSIGLLALLSPVSMRQMAKEAQDPVKAKEFITQIADMPNPLPAGWHYTWFSKRVLAPPFAGMSNPAIGTTATFYKYSGDSPRDAAHRIARVLNLQNVTEGNATIGSSTAFYLQGIFKKETIPFACRMYYCKTSSGDATVIRFDESDRSTFDESLVKPLLSQIKGVR